MRRLRIGIVIALVALLLAACEDVYFSGSAGNGAWKSYPYHEPITGGRISQDTLYVAKLELQTFQCFGPSSCPTILQSNSSNGFELRATHPTYNARIRCRWSYGDGGGSMPLDCSRFPA